MNTIQVKKIINKEKKIIELFKFTVLECNFLFKSFSEHYNYMIYMMLLDIQRKVKLYEHNSFELILSHDFDINSHCLQSLMKYLHEIQNKYFKLTPALLE